METEILLTTVNKILKKYEKLPEDTKAITESLVNEIAEEIADSMEYGDDLQDIVDFMNDVDLGKWTNVKL